MRTYGYGPEDRRRSNAAYIHTADFRPSHAHCVTARELASHFWDAYTVSYGKDGFWEVRTGSSSQAPVHWLGVLGTPACHESHVSCHDRARW